MVTISVPSDVLYTWAKQNARYVALLKSENFQNELKSAYETLVERAEGKVTIVNEQTFYESAKKKVAIQFGSEVAEAYFSGKEMSIVEEETISNSQWISKQIRFARDLAWHSIQIKIWEENRRALPQTLQTFYRDEGEGYWND